MSNKQLRNEMYEVICEISRCEVQKKKNPKDTLNLSKLAKAKQRYEQLRIERNEIVVAEGWKTTWSGKGYGYHR